MEGRVNAEALRKAAADEKKKAKDDAKKYREQMRELKQKTKDSNKESAKFDKAEYGEKLPARVSPHVTSEKPDEDLGMYESFVPSFADFVKLNLK